MLVSVVPGFPAGAGATDTAEQEVSAMADTLEKVHLLNELRDSASSPPASPLVTPSASASRATSGSFVPQPPAVDMSWRPEVTFPRPAPREAGGGLRRVKPPSNWKDGADETTRDSLKRHSRSPLQAPSGFGGGGALRRTKVRRFSAEAAFPSVDNLQALLGDATAFEVSSQQNSSAPSESMRRCASEDSLHGVNTAAVAAVAAAAQRPAAATTEMSAAMGPPPSASAGPASVAPWEAYRAWVKSNPYALKHECKSYLNNLLAGPAGQEAAGAASGALGASSAHGPVTM